MAKVRIQRARTQIASGGREGARVKEHGDPIADKVNASPEVGLVGWVKDQARAQPVAVSYIAPWVKASPVPPS
jgi:hypothetical protein